MGQGLSRGSPVKLTLGKDNYCALIERHGQWVRWRTASKCSCVSLPSMQPDIHCKLCGGRGVTYSYQKDQVCFESVCLKDAESGILEITDSHADCDLIEVYNFDGERFPNAEKLGNYVYLNHPAALKKGVYYNVIMRQSCLKAIDKIEVEKNDLGFYVVPDMKSQKPNVDGVYYMASGDIISIDKIVDANGIVYNPEEFRLNMFRILPSLDEEENEIEIKEPVTCYGVHYVPPFIFAILNQNLSKADAQMMVDLQGDAVVTFPYECDVASDDVLTVMAGSYTNKEVVARSDYETDTLGVYFVNDIVSCSGIINGEIVNYIEGKDFVLVGTNKIKWLGNAENYPESGDGYSIVYHALPTYKVIKQIPQLRTSENQRFPKKAIVKLFSTYAENAGVNKQVVGRKAIDGSY